MYYALITINITVLRRSSRIATKYGNLLSILDQIKLIKLIAWCRIFYFYEIPIADMTLSRQTVDFVFGDKSIKIVKYRCMHPNKLD